MSAEFTYDDERLHALFAAMEYKERLKALKGAFRREASAVRRVAVSNMRQSLNGGGAYAKAVRALVFKSQAGFRVTAGSRKMPAKNGERLKPVLVWAEDGTAERRTRGKGGRGSGRPTGRMPAYKFMDRTAKQVGPSVTSGLQDELRASVERTAKKYGCTIGA